MKVSPVSVSYLKQHKPSFYGQKFYFTSDMYGACPSLTESSFYAKNCGNEEVAKTHHPNPFCEVETVKGGTGKTAHVYWADPMEYVSPQRKSEYYYVVHEVEPPIPSIEKKVANEFFGSYLDRPFTNGYQSNIVKEFGYARDYFYRLEMADQKELNRLRENRYNDYNFDQLKEKIDYYQARVNESKHKQWQIAECIKLYQQAGKLLEEKKELDYTIYRLELDANGGLDESIAREEKKLKSAQEEKLKLEEELAKLSEKIIAYMNIIEINKSISGSNTNEENSMLAKNLANVQSMAKSLNINLNNVIASIAKIQRELSYDLQRKKELPQVLKEKQAMVAELKAKLIPYFDRLKKFCISQGLKL